MLLANPGLVFSVAAVYIIAAVIGDVAEWRAELGAVVPALAAARDVWDALVVRDRNRNRR